MYKKLIGLLLGIIVGIVIAYIPPMEPLNDKSMLALGILATALIWISFKSLPDFVAVLAMSTMWVVFKVAPTTVVFSNFATNTWWLLVGALGIGVAASESGLLKRISLFLMKVFPATFKGQSIALILASLITGPLIPSTTAKAVIMGPIAKKISESLGFEPNSNGAAGLFAAFYNGVVIAAPMFLSSSFVGYAAVGLIPEGKGVSWIAYFLYALPWSVVTIPVMAIIALKLYKPKTEASFSREEIQEQIDELGPWKKHEKITMAVLCFCLSLWMTEVVHRIPAAMVACAGMVILLSLEVYGRPEFRSKIAWDSVVFIGCIIGLGSVLSYVKVNDFIRVVLAPTIIPVMNNIWLFIPLFCLFFFAIRLVIASLVGSITIISLVLLPFAEAAGIHPFVIVFVPYACVNSFNTIYQNSPYITSRASVEGDAMVTHGKLFPYSLIYIAVSTIGCMACIPLWKALGLVA